MGYISDEFLRDRLSSATHSWEGHVDRHPIQVHKCESLVRTRLRIVIRLHQDPQIVVETIVTNSADVAEDPAIWSFCFWKFVTVTRDWADFVEVKRSKFTYGGVF
jgi:hypothetical protein